jgi:hypothetical protein
MECGLHQRFSKLWVPKNNVDQWESIPEKLSLDPFPIDAITSALLLPQKKGIAAIVELSLCGKPYSQYKWQLQM